MKTKTLLLVGGIIAASLTVCIVVAGLVAIRHPVDHDSFFPPLSPPVPVPRQFGLAYERTPERLNLVVLPSDPLGPQYSEAATSYFYV